MNSLINRLSQVKALRKRNVALLHRASRCAIEDLEPRWMLTTVSLAQNTMEVNASQQTPIVYTISRDNSVGNLTVNYRIGGEVSNSDFTAGLYANQGGQQLGSVVIANGATSATITAVPVNDPNSSINKTVTLALLAPDGGNYSLGTINQGTVRIDESAAISSKVINVGAGQTYATLSAAYSHFASGDTIDIFPSASNGGVYVNDNIDVRNYTNLTFRGIGAGRVTFSNTAGYLIPNNKGIIAVETTCTNTNFENLAFEGAAVPVSAGGNGAGLRLEGVNFTVNNCYFYDDQVGLQCSSNGTGNGTVLYSEFNYCGFPDGSGGQEHNVYVNPGLNVFTFEYNYSHNGESNGHLLKSRAAVNYVEYNRLIGQAAESYELSFPWGGQDYVIGNIIRQAPGTANAAIIDYASENTEPGYSGYSSKPGDFIYLINNTVVNDHNTTGSKFVQEIGNTSPNTLITSKNNIFAGPGSTYNIVGVNTTLTQSNNVVTTLSAAGFVNEAAGDYHLTAASPAIGEGTDPGSVNGYSLTPVLEPSSVNGAVPRAVKSPLDAGVFAYPASTTTTLASSSPTSTYGQAITFTANVTPSYGTGETGIVQFQVDGVTVGTSSLSGNTAVFTTMALAAGSHSVVAVYNGDSNFSASFSNSVAETVAKAASATSVAADNNSPTYGQTVTFTATVTPTVGAGPTGTVQFQIDGSNVGSPVALSGNTAAYSTSSLSVGNHSIVAVYSGDGNYTASTSSPLSLTVAAALTIITFENSSDVNNFKDLVGSDQIQWVSGNGGHVLNIPYYHSSNSIKYSPGGVDYQQASGVVGAQVHLQYHGSASPAGTVPGLITKTWIDNKNQTGSYSVALDQSGGNITLLIGASKSLSGSESYYSTAQGHSTSLKQVLTTYTPINDGLTHDLGWWTIYSTTTIVNANQVQIAVTITDTNNVQYNYTWTDSGSAAVVGNGLIGLWNSSLFSEPAQFDNFIYGQSGGGMMAVRASSSQPVFSTTAFPSGQGTSPLNAANGDQTDPLHRHRSSLFAA